MDIFEAVYWLYPQTSGEDHRAEEAEELITNPTSYHHLTAEEGHALALAALKLFDEDPDDDSYMSLDMLIHLANIVPGSLKGLYSRLLERGISGGDNDNPLFREADPATRDHMLSLIESETQYLYKREYLLSALAWIDDEVVLATFQQWRRTPPVWATSLSIAPEDYSRTAGWELTEQGTRRNLYSQECYSLIPVKEAEAAAIPGPVAVISAHEEHCRWCGRPLLTLFDMDLHDPRLVFLGLRGDRLRVAICVNCSMQWIAVFTNVDGYGKSQWSTENGERPASLRLSEKEGLLVTSWPHRRFVLGAARKTTYESQGSHIGGYPAWIQFPHYPRCPICQQTMMFIGQHEPQVEYIEGIIYAFLCVQCGKATTEYQQT